MLDPAMRIVETDDWVMLIDLSEEKIVAQGHSLDVRHVLDALNVTYDTIWFDDEEVEGGFPVEIVKR